MPVMCDLPAITDRPVPFARHKPARNSSIYGRSVALSLLLGGRFFNNFWSRSLPVACNCGIVRLNHML